MTFVPGVVVTVGPSRQDNLSRVLSDLDAQTLRPKRTVLVFDGIAPYALTERQTSITVVEAAKHVPGLDQPRNVGVRRLIAEEPDCTHVWFLDSDIEVGADCLQQFAEAYPLIDKPHLMVGPYDWYPQGVQGVNPNGPFFQRDIRWDDFNTYGPEVLREGWVGHGLACFSGNLVWPIREFTQVGGFHPNMHHGRCEDGELGLRAMTHGLGVAFVRDARGYHLHHDVNLAWVLQANARDVPLLNGWHDYAEAGGPVRLGQRFVFGCGVCGESVDSRGWWEHWGTHA